MANRSMVGLAAKGLTAVLMLAGAGVAEAAPPRCENITVEEMRRNCFERVERCEPLKTAAERDECYRGTKPNPSPNANPNPNAGPNGPIRLTRPDAAAGSPPPPPPPPPAGAPSPAPSARPAPVPAPPPPPPPGAAPPPPPAPPPPAPVVVRPNQPPVIAAPPPVPQPAPRAEPAPAPVVVRPAPPVPVAPTATAPVPRPPQGNGLETVRGFYEALAQADGARANGFLVPEKRNAGAYEIASLSRFYGAMREPLTLLSADPIGPDSFRVRYHYVYVNGRVCDGGAEVTLSRREGAPLIERIKALNGC